MPTLLVGLRGPIIILLLLSPSVGKYVYLRKRVEINVCVVSIIPQVSTLYIGNIVDSIIIM